MKNRFFSKILKVESCWEWHGRRSVLGYGVMRYQKKEILVHRMSYMIHHGEIPDGLCVLHACDNPPCVNPEHIFVGTTDDNNKDRSKKGRYLGEWNGRSKLTEAQVLEARRLHREKSYGPTKISLLFGLKPSSARAMLKGLTWKHLPA